MRLKDIADAVSEISNIDIRQKSRKDNLPLMRSIYFKIAKEHTGHGLGAIGEEVNIKTHGSVINGLDNFDHDIKKTVVKNIYIQSLKLLKLDTSHMEIPYYLLKHLKEYSDSELLEVYETRLKPFKIALDSRIDPKVIVKVKGALLNHQKL